MQDAWLRELAEAARPLEPDRYGAGDPTWSLERRVAEMLGKPAAVFMTKGVSAQIIALQIHAKARGVPVVALHPKCHLEVDESDAFRRVFGLAGVRLGSDHAPFGPADLAGVAERLGCVTVELPLRRAGFKATPWEDLAGIAAWCRLAQVPLHLDGARLWEVAPHYGRSHAEIAALGSSIYVSLYKGLGGLAGCVLAGEEAFVAEARLWQIRLGAVLPSAFPLAIAGHLGLDRRLPEMPRFHARAVALAARLGAVRGIVVSPALPHGNAFELFLNAPAERLDAAALALAASTGFWLAPRSVPTAIPGWSKIEVAIGRGADAWSDDEAVAIVTAWLDRARSGDAFPAGV